MKKKICIGFVCVVFAIVAGIGMESSAQASSAISMSVSGPINVSPGGTLTLKVNATNNLSANYNNSTGLWTENGVYWYSIQAVTLNPWTGQVVSGPNTLPAYQWVLSWYYDGQGSYHQASTLNPVTVSVILPTTAPRNQSLVEVLYAMDNNGNVIGTAYWGFVSK
ncbi:MAG: hypothetical protein ACP5SH_13540 [Syntrophobacteraceae bacterium]